MLTHTGKRASCPLVLFSLIFFHSSNLLLFISPFHLLMLFSRSSVCVCVCLLPARRHISEDEFIWHVCPSTHCVCVSDVERHKVEGCRPEDARIFSPLLCQRGVQDPALDVTLISFYLVFACVWGFDLLICLLLDV